MDMINKIGYYNWDWEDDVRQGDDNATWPLVDSSSLVQAHAISDPIFAPVRKVPPEILAKIFIECIPPFQFKNLTYLDNGDSQRVRAQLGQVCRVWNTILNDEPGVWATLALENPLPALEIVSLWIKRSKAHPLDVSLHTDKMFLDSAMGVEAAVVKLLRRELWRIRSFFVDSHSYDLSPLFPPNLLTEVSMMQSLMLPCGGDLLDRHRGWIHCPQLHTLIIQGCGKGVESLISKPMQNLHVLTITGFCVDDMSYTKLLHALPNLISLTWHNFGRPLQDESSRVVLRSLKSLTLRTCRWETMRQLLRHLDVPLLEHLDVGRCGRYIQGGLNMVLDVICGDGVVQLRHLTLGEGALRDINFHALWHHLKHLETLFINGVGQDVDELLIALSPPNRDFSSICPRLKTLELSTVMIGMGALVDFVQRRVKSDLGGPGPGLVTCLKLSDMWVDTEVSAQLVKTHSLSVHLPTY